MSAQETRIRSGARFGGWALLLTMLFCSVGPSPAQTETNPLDAATAKAESGAAVAFPVRVNSTGRTVRATETEVQGLFYSREHGYFWGTRLGTGTEVMPTSGAADQPIKYTPVGPVLTTKDITLETRAVSTDKEPGEPPTHPVAAEYPHTWEGASTPVKAADPEHSSAGEAEDCDRAISQDLTVAHPGSGAAGQGGRGQRPGDRHHERAGDEVRAAVSAEADLLVGHQNSYQPAFFPYKQRRGEADELAARDALVNRLQAASGTPVMACARCPRRLTVADADSSHVSTAETAVATTSQPCPREVRGRINSNDNDVELYEKARRIADAGGYPDFNPFKGGIIDPGVLASLIRKAEAIRVLGGYDAYFRKIKELRGLPLTADELHRLIIDPCLFQVWFPQSAFAEEDDEPEPDEPAVADEPSSGGDDGTAVAAGTGDDAATGASPGDGGATSGSAPFDTEGKEPGEAYYEKYLEDVGHEIGLPPGDWDELPLWLKRRYAGSERRMIEQWELQQSREAYLEQLEQPHAGATSAPQDSAPDNKATETGTGTPPAASRGPADTDTTAQASKKSASASGVTSSPRTGSTTAPAAGETRVVVRPNRGNWPDGKSVKDMNRRGEYIVEVWVPAKEAKGIGQTLDVTVSSEAGDDSDTMTLTSEFSGTGGTHVVYTHRTPITLEDGGPGGDHVTILGLEMSLGDLDPIDTTNGDTVTVSYGNAKTEVVAYDTSIQQALARNVAFLEKAHAYYNRRLQDGSLTDAAKNRLTRKIRLVQNALAFVSFEPGETYSRGYTDYHRLGITEEYVGLVLSDISGWTIAPAPEPTGIPGVLFLSPTEARAAAAGYTSGRSALSVDADALYWDLILTGAHMVTKITLWDAGAKVFAGIDSTGRRVDFTERLMAGVEIGSVATLAIAGPAVLSRHIGTVKGTKGTRINAFDDVAVGAASRSGRVRPGAYRLGGRLASNLDDGARLEGAISQAQRAGVENGAIDDVINGVLLDGGAKVDDLGRLTSAGVLSVQRSLSLEIEAAEVLNHALARARQAEVPENLIQGILQEAHAVPGFSRGGRLITSGAIQVRDRLIVAIANREGKTIVVHRSNGFVGFGPAGTTEMAEFTEFLGGGIEAGSTRELDLNIITYAKAKAQGPTASGWDPRAVDYIRNEILPMSDRELLGLLEFNVEGNQGRLLNLFSPEDVRNLRAAFAGDGPPLATMTGRRPAGGGPGTGGTGGSGSGRSYDPFDSGMDTPVEPPSAGDAGVRFDPDFGPGQPHQGVAPPPPPGRDVSVPASRRVGEPTPEQIAAAERTLESMETIRNYELSFGSAAECPPAQLGPGQVIDIPWRSWQNYTHVTHEGRRYAQVGNRLYTRHAVDRTQPSGLGAPAGQEGAGRSFPPSLVDYVIRNGAAEQVIRDGVVRTVHTLGTASVVTEQGGRIVITVNPF